MLSIGVSNFEPWMLDELNPPAAVNQVLYRIGFHDDVLYSYGATRGTVTQVGGASGWLGGRLGCVFIDM